MHIRPFKKADFEQVKDIYQQGIDTGNATFQQTAKSWSEWNGSMLNSCRLVATENNTILGWAALSPTSNRYVYRGVCEVSIYISAAAQGKGVGHQLMSALVACSEQHDIWTIQAAIFPENKSSIALHLKHGFRELGTREKVGQMNGVWRDSVLLERRSKVVGI
ncbi:N-acetyltransferase family protein [Colwelliaceae bacterium 6471]